MTDTINRSTGEIATADTSSEIAVTSYLQHARDWLATAVESTGPEQIAAAKAEIATAAEATKQLGLSKDIQGDAAEMVRRAEYALRKVTQKAQDAGEIALPGNPQFSPDGVNSKPSPVSYFTSKREYEDANAMAALGAEDFDEVLAEAKAEDNLSRANVAAKARDVVKAAAEQMVVDFVAEFPALKFFADRGEMRRVIDLGVALREYGPDEQVRRLEILDKTIAYERRKDAGDLAPTVVGPKPLVGSIVSAFRFAGGLVRDLDAIEAEISSATRSDVATWHSKLSAALPHLEQLIEATAPKLRRIK